MALFSLLAVLLVEQIRPLPYRHLVHEPLSRLAAVLEHRLNAGMHAHGVLAWVLAVGGATLCAALVHYLLQAINPLLAWLFDVFVLYLTMGFRQFGQHYSRLQEALRLDDLPRARRLLALWGVAPVASLSATALARRSIEAALLAAHRQVFGALVCFVLLPGPCGALLYRLAAFLAAAWGRQDTGDDDFGRFARQAFAFIDWLPSRITASAFALVGDFEGAVFCWRTQASGWVDECFGRGTGIVLASGAGALGVRLGTPPGALPEKEGCVDIGLGGEADADRMQSALGLLWRVMILGLLLLALVFFSTTGG